MITSWTKEQTNSAIDTLAPKYGMNPELIRRVVHQESRFNPNATSHAGAQGLMQLMPETAKELGVRDSFDPAQNLEGGIKYLSQQSKRFGGDMRLALAAYNAGAGNVQKAGNQVPNFKETQDYVHKIWDTWDGNGKESTASVATNITPTNITPTNITPTNVVITENSPEPPKPALTPPATNNSQSSKGLSSLLVENRVVEPEVFKPSPYADNVGLASSLLSLNSPLATPIDNEVGTTDFSLTGNFMKNLQDKKITAPRINRFVDRA